MKIEKFLVKLENGSDIEISTDNDIHAVIDNIYVHRDSIWMSARRKIKKIPHNCNMNEIVLLTHIFYLRTNKEIKYEAYNEEHDLVFKEKDFEDNDIIRIVIDGMIYSIADFMSLVRLSCEELDTYSNNIFSKIYKVTDNEIEIIINKNGTITIQIMID